MSVGCFMRFVKKDRGKNTWGVFPCSLAAFVLLKEKKCLHRVLVGLTCDTIILSGQPEDSPH